MRPSTGVAAALVLTAGIIGLTIPQAAASPAAARSVVHHLSGASGDSGHLVCGTNTRAKNGPGSIDMVLHQAPTGKLTVRLQDVKNGTFIGEQKLLTVGTATTTLVSNVLAGTQFHVCAASPSGSPGGPYQADLTY